MRDSPDTFRRLVDLLPDGVLLISNGHIEIANPAALRLLGAAAVNAVAGRAVRDFIPPELSALAQSSAAATALGKVTALDGTVRELRIDVSPASGGSLAMILREATAAELADAALRENEERLTLAVAGALEGVWDWNLETNAVIYSPRWTQMLGYAEDEIEPHVSAWERLVHPDDRSRADRAHASVAAGAPTYEAEFRLRHKSGHYVHVLSRGFPIRRTPDGPVVRIVGTHLDLTDRKRAEMALRDSEERLRLAFAGAQEGVWDWDLETGAVVYSPRWAEMLGYSVDEIEPHITSWERLLHPDDRELADELNERVRRGERTYEGEFRLRHKDGRYIHVLSRGYPVRREPGGPVIRIVGTHFDLTERKLAEQRLRRAHEELERRVRERTVELAAANEALRTEMAERERAERARTDLLARLVFAQEDERRRIAREMHDQFGEQLTALSRRIEVLRAASAGRADLTGHVDALHDLAQRIDGDVEHLVWELRPTALDDLGLRAALANYVQDWSQRVNIAAQLHTSGLLDERLASEAETTLYRIAQEALTNVAKHARAARVDVILERRDGDVLLIVEDDGVGFERSGTGGAGHGFGLLGMQERAALVGATLEIESSAGQGTTVLLRMASGPAQQAVQHG